MLWEIINYIEWIRAKFEDEIYIKNFKPEN